LLFAEHQVGLLGDGPRSVVQDFERGGRCRSAAWVRPSRRYEVLKTGL